jgi:hypothetical protein
MELGAAAGFCSGGCRSLGGEVLIEGVGADLLRRMTSCIEVCVRLR